MSSKLSILYMHNFIPSVNTPTKEALVILGFQMRPWDSGRLSELPKEAERVMGETRVPTQSLTLESQDLLIMLIWFLLAKAPWLSSFSGLIHAFPRQATRPV